MKKYIPVDVGDAQQVDQLEIKVRNARDREIYELGEILKTYGGRAFIWRALEQCKDGKFISTHPHDTFLELGHQDVGHWLRDEVFTSDINSFTLMYREAQERREEAQKVQERDDDG